MRAAARLAYVAAILFATWAGLQASFDPYLAWLRLGRALTPTFRPADVLDAVRNVALFAGFGAVWLATADPLRLGREVWRATLWGTLLSVAVEAAQLFSATRFASVLDVFTNGGGALLGAAGVALAIGATARERAHLRHAGRIPPVLGVLAYAVAGWCEAFSAYGRPDQVPDAWGARQRWRAAVAELGPNVWTIPPGVGVDALLFAPLGGWLALAFLRRGASRAGAVLATTGLAALGWASAELARGVAGADLRPMAAVIRLAATVVGAGIGVALVTGRDRRRAPRPPGWVAPAGYALLLALWSWRPFDLTLDPAQLARATTREAWIPLRSLVADFQLHTVADVVAAFLLFVPVGAWDAVRRAAGQATPGLAAGLALAVLLELGQIVVRDRWFDVTDIFVQVAGVLVGSAIVRRADRRRERLLGEAPVRDRDDVRASARAPALSSAR